MMTFDTTQYGEFFQRGQEAVRTAVDTWTRTVTTAGGQLPTFTPQLDAEAAIERYFELNEKLLGVQRDFAKQLVGYATAAGAAVQERVESVVRAGAKA
jgi:hypothetical protein